MRIKKSGPGGPKVHGLGVPFEHEHRLMVYEGGTNIVLFRCYLKSYASPKRIARNYGLSTTRKTTAIISKVGISFAIRKVRDLNRLVSLAKFFTHPENTK